MTVVSQASRRLSIIDETVNSVAAEDCSLFMQLAVPFFTMAIADRNRNKYIALCEYRLSEKNTAEELNALIEKDDLIKKTGYSKECIAIYTEHASLIPSPLFSRERSHELLAMTSRVPSESILCADELKYTDAVHLYALPSELVTVIRKHFPFSAVVHTGTVFIESELMRNKNNPERSIGVNVRQRNFDVVVTEGDKLLLYNSFAYQTSEDFIYFLLHVMEQLKLNPETAVLTFTGDIEKQSSAYLISAKYIRNIRFGGRPDAFDYSYGFAQVSEHNHHILLNEFLCVS